MADLPLSQTQATSEERALSDLAQKCSDISQSLLAILNGLKVDSKSQFRTWKSLKASLRSGRKGEVIKSLQTKLHQITSQLNSHLLYALRYEAPLSLLFKLSSSLSSNKCPRLSRTMGTYPKSVINHTLGH